MEARERALAAGLALAEGDGGRLMVLRPPGGEAEGGLPPAPAGPLPEGRRPWQDGARPRKATLMQPQALVDRLARHPLLEGFGAGDLEALAGRGRLRRAAEGDVLYRQGEPADELCLLLDGAAEVRLRSSRGFDHDLARVEAGGALGELGLLSGGQRAATVTAASAVEFFVLPAAQLRRLLDDGEPVGARLLERLARTVAGRLREMNARLAGLVDEQQHPDGTVRLSVADIRERLLQAGAAGG